MNKYGELLQAIDDYAFLAIAKNIYGPFTRKDGRQIVIVKYENGSRTVSYPKWIMEQKLGRQLDPNRETVHHRDGNYRNNDHNNLELIPRKEHSTNDTRRVKPVKFKCDMCGKKFERSPRLVRATPPQGTVARPASA